MFSLFIRAGIHISHTSFSLVDRVVLDSAQKVTSASDSSEWIFDMSVDNTKRFSCDTCNKGFRTSSLLATHRHTHTGEKPCKCDLCGSAFSKVRELKVHTWIHTGEKPYKYVKCGKEFRTSGHLLVHTRIHTGEKPYR